MTAERITLDTNILFYFVDTETGAKHAIARQIIEHAQHADCRLTLQVVGEFYHAITRRRVLPVRMTAELARGWLDMFPTIAASAPAVQLALSLSETGATSYWGGLLVATAAEAGCTSIITEDLADGSVVAGVRVLAPFL
ncbi:MAG TPA: PIN domain-containing protein, partial [Acetobacteraceae bacterium]|nr:PIN domain-containing protein [Acetobacteraceae bacterium]